MNNSKKIKEILEELVQEENLSESTKDLKKSIVNKKKEFLKANEQVYSNDKKEK